MNTCNILRPKTIWKRCKEHCFGWLMMEYQIIPEYGKERQDNFKGGTSSLSNVNKGFFFMHLFNYYHESFPQLGSFIPYWLIYLDPERIIWTTSTCGILSFTDVKMKIEDEKISNAKRFRLQCPLWRWKERHLFDSRLLISEKCMDFYKYLLCSKINI